MKKWHGIHEEEVSQLIRIFALEERIDKKGPSYVIPWKPTNLEEAYRFYLKVEEGLVEKYSNQALKVIGVDSIVHYFGEKEAMILANLETAREKYAGGLAIWLAKPIYPEIIENVKPLTDVHLKITKRHGCLLLYGVKPRTPLCAVNVDTSKGYILTKLTPIV